MKYTLAAVRKFLLFVLLVVLLIFAVYRIGWQTPAPLMGPNVHVAINL